MSGASKPKATPADAQSEIDQIMNDIAELQKEIENPNAAQDTTATTASASAEEDALKDFRAGAAESEASLESTLAELGDEPSGSGTSLLDQVLASDVESPSDTVEETEVVAEEVVEEENLPDEPIEEEPMSHRHSDSEAPAATDGTLTLQLQGTMTLKLKYEADGHEITVGFSEGCLKVQLADGTEFKVPVSNRAENQGKKARPLRRVA